MVFAYLIQCGWWEVFLGNLFTIAVAVAVVWFVFLMIDLVDWIDEKIKNRPGPPDTPAPA